MSSMCLINDYNVLKAFNMSRRQMSRKQMVQVLTFSMATYMFICILFTEFLKQRACYYCCTIKLHNLRAYELLWKGSHQRKSS